MKKIFTIAFGAAILMSGSLFAQSSFYVSSQYGDDAWSGLLDSPNVTHTDGPFQSLQRAQSAMRGSSSKKAYLRAGTLMLTANLQFGSADNGESWQNYSGETPVIDGNNSYRFLLNNVGNLTMSGLTLQNLAGGCTASCGNLGAISGNASNLVFQYNSFNNCTNACLMGSFQHAMISNNRFNNLAPGIGPVGDNFAIWLYYGSSNNNISHNSFQNLQGGGVSLGAGPYDPPVNNNIVDRNYLNNIDTNVFVDGIGDIGALYIGDYSHNSVGNQFTNNVILNNCGTNYTSEICKAIYVDAGSSNVLVTGNICQNCGTFAFQNHGGDHVTVQNNIFDLSSSGTRMGLYQQDLGSPDYGMANNVFTNNIIYTSGPASSVTVWTKYTGANDALPAVWDNLYYAAGGGSWANPSNGIADSAPVYANPQFTSPSGANYSMPATSPAYTLVGFQPLPTDQGPAGSAGSLVSTPASTTTSVSSTAAPPIANGSYAIRNSSSGLVLDDPGYAPPGAQVVQYPVQTPVASNQRWMLTLVDGANGHYTIVNQASGGYLTDTGTALYENYPTSAANQLWTISSGSGAYVIKNVATARVADDPGFASAPLTGIVTWPANGGTNQGWALQQVQ